MEESISSLLPQTVIPMVYDEAFAVLLLPPLQRSGLSTMPCAMPIAKHLSLSAPSAAYRSAPAHSVLCRCSLCCRVEARAHGDPIPVALGVPIPLSPIHQVKAEKAAEREKLVKEAMQSLHQLRAYLGLSLGSLQVTALIMQPRSCLPHVSITSHLTSHSRFLCCRWRTVDRTRRSLTHRPRKPADTPHRPTARKSASCRQWPSGRSTRPRARRLRRG